MAAQLYTFTKNREFPSNAVVMTLYFQYRGPGFNQSLVRELRSRKLHSMAKIKKKKNFFFTKSNKTVHL